MVREPDGETQFLLPWGWRPSRHMQRNGCRQSTPWVILILFPKTGLANTPDELCAAQGQ